eukprot:g3600.t1
MAGASLDGGYKVYRARWYVLFAFSLVSLLQSMIWLTYSPVAETTKRYYGLCKTDAECKSENGPGQSTVDLFLNWGPIMYLLTVFPTMWLATRKNALRRIVLLSVFLETAAVALRALPTLVFTPDQGNPPPWYMIPCVHLGQICNAAVGPLVMATCTLLSASWFPAHERGTATSIAVVANNIGSFTGFFGAFVVNDSVHNLPKLLWIHFGIVMVALVLVLAYFPAKPPTPPSSSSVAREKQLEQNENASYLFLDDTRKALRMSGFMWLALVGGVVNGVYNVWSGSLDTILPNNVVTTKQCALLGAGSTAAYCIGGILVGPVIDRVEFFKRRYKAAMLMLLVVSTLLFAWFTLSLPFLTVKRSIFPTSFASLAISIIASGFFLGCSNPLFYEFGVELTFPLTEATSGGIITIFNNFGALVLLAVKSDINTAYINVLMAGTVLGTVLIILFFVKEKYLRKDHEDLQQSEKLLSPANASNRGEYIF